MTEAVWLTCTNPDPMFRYLEKTPHTAQRKSRLVAVACCRRLSYWLADPVFEAALDVIERFADGLASQAELVAVDRDVVASVDRLEMAEDNPETTNAAHAFYQAAQAVEEAAYDDPDSPYAYRMTDVVLRTAYAAGYAATAGPRKGDGQDRQGYSKQAESAERQSLAKLVREVFGNPFRPVAFNPAWRTSTVVALAKGMYGSRDFSAMPILADALQDAGCDSDDILDHCRDANATHVRGCWVVDLVLGKS
jgi:hypothetical protein